MKIAIGCDIVASELKHVVIDHLKAMGHEIVDYGNDDDKDVLYPDVAYNVAKAVADGEFERAILICGTGIGVAITANKVVGVRAATAHDVYSAERARKSNNAQILTFGSQIIGTEV
ncbi:MAG: RpiB/LacA/LacB family sugar-phosphate isomerase, partial [Erysipelothrix sp.]|nr:RpiB/LacA/LacB family sugar-phosphate isomerase [Erysipelothrix sp.]